MAWGGAKLQGSSSSIALDVKRKLDMLSPDLNMLNYKRREINYNANLVLNANEFYVPRYFLLIIG